MRQRFRRQFLAQPAEVRADSADEKLLQRALAIIEERLSDSRFNTAELAQSLGWSRGHFNEKLKAITGSPPGELIRRVRLQRARQLLEQPGATVSQVAYQVGFENLSNFAKRFREAYQETPRAYGKKHRRHLKEPE